MDSPSIKNAAACFGVNLAMGGMMSSRRVIKNTMWTLGKSIESSVSSISFRQTTALPLVVRDTSSSRTVPSLVTATLSSKAFLLLKAWYITGWYFGSSPSVLM